MIDLSLKYYKILKMSPKSPSQLHFLLMDSSPWRKASEPDKYITQQNKFLIYSTILLKTLIFCNQCYLLLSFAFL